MTQRGSAVPGAGFSQLTGHDGRAGVHGHAHKVRLVGVLAVVSAGLWTEKSGGQARAVLATYTHRCSGPSGHGW